MSAVTKLTKERKNLYEIRLAGTVSTDEHIDRPKRQPFQSRNAPEPLHANPVNGTQFVRHTRNTFITSSPKWLITFTAMRPDFGFSKGREVSLCSVAQASALISAFRVVFKDL